MDKPIVYMSATCRHSRELLGLIEKTGFADAYSFVNVDRARKLPDFVDRVPLLYNGATIVTDQSLFNMFADATSVVGTTQGASHHTATRHPQSSKPTQAGVAAPNIAPADTLCGGAFSSMYSLVSGEGSKSLRADSCWRLDEHHESIDTPDCEPMPSRDKPRS